MNSTQMTQMKQIIADFSRLRRHADESQHPLLFRGLRVTCALHEVRGKPAMTALVQIRENPPNPCHLRSNQKYSKMIQIVILDSHYPFGFAVQHAAKTCYPGIQVTAIASSEKSFFDNIDKTGADMAMIGVNYPEPLKCLDITRRLRRMYPNVKILATGKKQAERTTNAMWKAGINGFIPKEGLNDEDLQDAIRKVAAGDVYEGRRVIAKKRARNAKKRTVNG
jgi:CheY-like chemotaxis protein